MYKVAIHKNCPGADLADYLRSLDYQVFRVSDDGLIEGLSERAFDIAVIDKPETATILREINLKIGIIYMPPGVYQEDFAKSINCGADLCIPTPYAIEEAAAYIKGLLKRTGHISRALIYHINAYVFNVEERTVTLGDLVQRLTNKQAVTLELLCEFMDTLASRELLLKKGWSDTNYYNGRQLDSVVSALRKVFALDKRISLKVIPTKGIMLCTK